MKDKSRIGMLARTLAFFSRLYDKMAAHQEPSGLGVSGKYSNRAAFYSVAAPRCHTQRKTYRGYTRQRHGVKARRAA